MQVKEEEKKDEKPVSHQSSILSFVSESIASTPSSKGKEDPKNKASSEKAKDSKQMGSGVLKEAAKDVPPIVADKAAP